MRHLILRRLWSLRPPSICELFQFPFVSVPVSIPCSQLWCDAYEQLSTVNRWRGGNFADVIVLMILIYETGTESDATHAASRSRSGRSVADGTIGS